MALSGSRISRTYISQHTTLAADLLNLLHTGSPRIQRQVLMSSYLNYLHKTVIKMYLFVHFLCYFPTLGDGFTAPNVARIAPSRVRFFGGCRRSSIDRLWHPSSVKLCRFSRQVIGALTDLRHECLSIPHANTQLDYWMCSSYNIYNDRHAQEQKLGSHWRMCATLPRHPTRQWHGIGI